MLLPNVDTLPHEQYQPQILQYKKLGMSDVLCSSVEIMKCTSNSEVAKIILYYGIVLKNDA